MMSPHLRVAAAVDVAAVAVVVADVSVVAVVGGGDNVTYVVAVDTEVVTAIGSCWFHVYLWAFHAVVKVKLMQLAMP